MLIPTPGSILSSLTSPSLHLMHSTSLSLSSDTLPSELPPPPSTLGFQPPPTTTLLSFPLITLLSYLAYSFWSKTLVPQKRLELSKSKRTGEVKQYLEDLSEGDEGRDVEKWLFSDWLNPGKKSRAVPFLKEAKWNSGDNPVLATMGILLIPILYETISRFINHQ
ncbi:hypothetical protein TrLO_g299 [Triparma laevis f. longispina]|uniref:Uncharacterized protein n=1 Tax=Triparma laevis f. longispina TaxID=1714387 RepID=A0A9W7FP41_9STRA|nr:hypothetical protein TrLO_g299 [Triparma laevis f. longispina]